MNESPRGIVENRAQLARALTALKDLRSQVDELKQSRSEPIAIIGLGCRYPGGVHDAESFWHLLRDGRDAIGEVPRDRWNADAYYAADPDTPGKIVTRFGGFLDQVDQFDPYFFGIAPREASSLDPQQRLLLEVAWETLEHAGLAADRLQGSRTGVFVGICASEYAQLLLDTPPEKIDSYLASGNASSVAAGRLSYLFGFEGPSIAVDTACSSSLVSVHLACQSLRLGECDVALAGGVNVILTPAVSINHSRARMLAPDGRCKTFDARADGFVRSEGCGLVALKRLSRAIADGDPILAQIRGSATNQDGRTSGLTVPSGPAQQKVIREALAFAGLSPRDISYVEAHGTGTALGDPIELNALSAVFGERPDQPALVVGSVKTNIGHAEAAAGVAGLIKVVLALNQHTIPASLHFNQPTHRVSWSDMPISVAASAMPWQRGLAPRIAGVSSFGFGGTNAHVVISEPPPPASRAASPARPLSVLALSAQTQDALKQLAGRYAAHLEAHPDQSVGDICHTANTGRSHLQYRLAAVAETGIELAARLAAFAATGEADGVTSRKADTVRLPRTAFLCTGQGSQYAGMGRKLFETQPTFRADLQLCNDLLIGELERPLLDVLHADPADDSLHQTFYTQSALFAVEYALARLWMSWGVVPDLLVGHSLGEYVAACLAGVFSLEDAIRLVAARARLMQSLPGGGGMAAVFATEAEARLAISAIAPDVSIAAINGPRHVVLSGACSSLDRLSAYFAAAGTDCNALNVSHAFHSVLIKPMLHEFERIAATVSFSARRLDLISNVTGKLIGAEISTPEYWVRHAREPVQFLAAMRTCEDQEITALLEIGPAPVLLGMARHCVSADIARLPSLRRGQGDWRTMLESLGALHVRGVQVDWQAFDAPYGSRRVRAPTYPFQRRRYWAVPQEQSGSRRSLRRRRNSPHHLFLGMPVHAAREPHVIVFESELVTGRYGFIDDHRILDASIMPASGYIELSLAAANAALTAPRVSLDDLVFHQPLALPERGVRIVQTSLQADGAGRYEFRVRSRDGDGPQNPEWTLHATAMLRVEAGSHDVRQDLTALRKSMAEAVPMDTLYTSYAERGVVFGPSLRVVDEVWRGDGAAIGRVSEPQDADDYWLHPAWLAACAQVLGAAAPASDVTYLEASIRQVQVYRRPDGPAWCYARMRPTATAGRSADLLLLDDTGEVLAELHGVEARPTKTAWLQQPSPGGARPEFYSLGWVARPRAEGRNAGVPAPAAIAAVLRPRFEHALQQAPLLAYADGLAELDALVPDLVIDAFRQLGWPYRAGHSLTFEDAQRDLGVVLRYAQLLERLLTLLTKHGVLRRAGTQWQMATDLPAPMGIDDAGERHAGAQAEFELLRRCGSRLADVLTGRCDPLQLLFPDGDHSAAAKIYSDSPGAAAMHSLLRTAVARMRETWPAGRPFRVLEIGAGTGGASAYVLPELPHQTEYVYTDVSRGFFADARSRFAAYPFIRYQPLDIERSPGDQGFAGQEFDLVIAFNVLHATRRLRETVGHVRDLLADGGTLLLLENTEPADWVDLIWGLTPGWWRFEDRDLRPAYPLLNASQWSGLLTASGFGAVETIAADRQKNEILARQALFIARKNARADAAAERPKTWLILADSGGHGDELARAIESRGGQATRVYSGVGFARTEDGAFTVDPLAPGDFHSLLAEVTGPNAKQFDKVLHMWGLDAPSPDGLTAGALMSESLTVAGSAMHLVQVLAAKKPATPPRLWVVTRGAQPIGDHPPQLVQSSLWGMGKGIARDHPELWGGMLDLDPSSTTDDIARIQQEVTDPDGEDHVAFRAGERLIARLQPYRAIAEGPVPVSADGTYLITGGCGALGLETAHGLVEQGCRHLVLVGRSGAATEAAANAIAALETRGASVSVIPADVADETDMSRVLAQISQSGFSLRGIVHAAGLPGHSLIADLDLAALRRMFEAKVAGTWILHRLTCEMKLDFFVCFSSMVSLWGAKGQSHYAAANHFVDGFAHYRRALGLQALSVNWGPLHGGGMLPPETVSELERIGVTATPLDAAAQTLAALMRSDAAQIAAVAIHWPKLQSTYQSQGPCRMFDHVAARADIIEVPSAPLVRPRVLERLHGAPESERCGILLSFLQSTVSEVLGLEASRVPDPSQGFFDMGMDSLTAIEFRAKLQAGLAISLPATLIFDYGTLGALVDFLLRDKLGVIPTAAPAVERQVEDRGMVTQAMLEQMSEEETEALLEAKLLAL